MHHSFSFSQQLFETARKYWVHFKEGETIVKKVSRWAVGIAGIWVQGLCSQTQQLEEGRPQTKIIAKKLRSTIGGYKETPSSSAYIRFRCPWAGHRSGKLQYWAPKMVQDIFKHRVTLQMPLLSSFFIYHRPVHATSSMSRGTPWKMVCRF